MPNGCVRQQLEKIPGVQRGRQRGDAGKGAVGGDAGLQGQPRTKKYPSGGHSVTGGSHKGTGEQPQSRVTARSAKELERLGARTWIEATRKGRFRFAELENITYYCTVRGNNAYDVAKGPPGPCGECGESH